MFLTNFTISSLDLGRLIFGLVLFSVFLQYNDVNEWL